MIDYPTVDRVIADLKRLSAGFWHADREREIGNVMVDARHCLIQLMTTAEQLRSEAADAKKWAMSERSLRWQALAEAPADSGDEVKCFRCAQIKNACEAAMEAMPKGRDWDDYGIAQ